MNLKLDKQTVWLVSGVLVVLVISSLIGWILSLRVTSEASKVTVKNLNARIRAWWVMVAVFGFAVATGGIGSIILFAITSFLALREFITLTPTRPGDHRSLFWIFSSFCRFSITSSPSNGMVFFRFSSPSMRFCFYRSAAPLPGIANIFWNVQQKSNGA